MDEQTKKNAPKESTIKGRKRGALFIVLAIALFFRSEGGSCLSRP